MQIDMTCPGCGRALRIDSEHAGKSARCPLCNTIYTVPASAATTTSATAPGDRWYLKTPEGQSYGPVSRAVLDEWVREGRISDDCKLLQETEGIWQGAAAFYPVLAPPKVATPQPVFDNPVAGNPYASPETAGASPVRIVSPHRGGLVLALGILSWMLGCPVFGVMAWVMGSNDLRDIQRGAMDSNGLGLTQAGRIVGMIHAIITLIGIVVGIFTLLALGMWR